MLPIPISRFNKRVSQLLLDMAHKTPPEGLRVRSLLEDLGQSGLLLACIILALPCVLPIPVPGISVPQGLLIALVGAGLACDRTPWLPRRLLDLHFQAPLLGKIFRKGAALLKPLERISRPRLLALSAGGWVRTFNSTILLTAALILAAPFPIPFSNVLPAYAVIFLALGTLERDGWMVLAGYLAMMLSVAYVAVMVFFGAAWLSELFRFLTPLF